MGRKEYNIKIQELPLLERPYEKLEKRGANILSNAELLAIIIKTGTKDKNVVQITQKLLTHNSYKKEGFRFLHNISIEELKKHQGIGKIKAIQLKALSEIIKRASAPTLEYNLKIKSPKDIAEHVMSTLRYETKEEIQVALIDIKGNLKNILPIQKGSINGINVEIKDVFKEAIKQDIPRIIVIHNHPSGDPTPSIEDINFTKLIQKTGRDLSIEVMDHIVIGDGIYQSIVAYMNNQNMI